MKKKIRAIVIVLLVLAAITVFFNEVKYMIKHKKDADRTETATEDIDYSIYYSYSEVEDMVDYLADTEDKSDELSRLIDPLTKSQPITVTYIKNVVSVISVPDSVYSKELSGMGNEDYVTREQFDNIYHNIADTGRVKGLCRRDIFVYNVMETDMVSISDGRDSFSLSVGLPDDYRDKIVDVYMKNGSIFKINGYGSSEAVLENVWVKNVSEGKCTFLYNGIEKEYAVPEESSESSADAGSSGYVASLRIDNTGIKSITKPEKTVKARILGIADNGLKVEDNGTVPYSENFEIYNVYEGAVCEESIPVLAGYKNVELSLESGEIVAAVINDKLVSDDIRVIISNDNFTSYDMKTVSFTCDSEFEVKYSEDESSVYEAGIVVEINSEEYEDGAVLEVIPREYSGKLKLLSISRSYGNPECYGSLELIIGEDSINIINELPLERYLYSVVSSEMPSTFPDEALKAMAICARGYAYTKMNDESFADYNAHLDDSSLCQVYNNVQETPETIKAVKDTYGLVPTYNGELIVPLYFSTSCGTTCTNEEIWGGSAYPYLESNVENFEKNSIDLSEEEAFRQFIYDSAGYDIIDKDMPYYRWHIEYTREEISEAINSMLEERVSMSSDNIKVKNANGDFVSGEISDIGQVESISITSRSKSGVVLTMEIEGTEATIEVTGQTNIRNLITPVNQDIIRQDESVVSGWTSLPSPYYYIDQNENGFVIYGGGFGHGSGMSQNGAGVLADLGYNYRYILRHYYSYIDFESIYTIEDEEEE